MQIGAINVPAEDKDKIKFSKLPHILIAVFIRPPAVFITHLRRFYMPERHLNAYTNNSEVKTNAECENFSEKTARTE